VGTQLHVKVASAAVMTAATTLTGGTESAQLTGSFVHYEAWYHVLICKKHEYALQSLSVHLCNQHSMLVKARKATIEKYCSYALVDPTGILLPPPFRPPFEALVALMRAYPRGRVHFHWKCNRFS
jgi:hypothetical protein